MIAVTGANGLLGSFIVRALLDNNFPVAAIVRANSDTSSLAGVLDSVSIREADVLNAIDLAAALNGVTTVVHTAAVVSFNPRKAKKILEINVTGTANVVDACLELNIPKIVHISSVAALGRKRGATFIDEESKWIESDLNSDYAESKYLAELEVFRGMEEGLEISIVNPSVVLAPADWNKSSAQLFRYVWDERKFYTNGSINYVDVRDVAEMIVCLCRGNFNGQRFIASAGAMPTRDFFHDIARRFGKKGPSIRVRAPWTEVAGWLEEIKSLITGTEPLVTRQSARVAIESFQYSGEKSETLIKRKFRGVQESLDWCCSEYLRKITINK